jgi:hypothetical protein
MVTNSVGWVVVGNDYDFTVWDVVTVCRVCRDGGRLLDGFTSGSMFWRDAAGRDFGLEYVDCSVCGADELPWDGAVE